MTENPNIIPYARAVVRLLQGVVYNDDPFWKDILQNQLNISEYLEKIGIELVVDQPDGYAYIKQIPLDDEGSTVGLVRRMPMTYEASLVCIFLREKLDDFDIGDHLNYRCLVSHAQLKEDMELFFKEKANFKKFLRNMDKHIRKVMDYGFLKLHRQGEKDDDNLYEIKRIIKAKISSDQIESFRQKMEEYA
ncbi:MAG: DUF4194 domain-containing protein [bacterium]|nr:DUF4194 domain-containing protein [bacterium]